MLNRRTNPAGIALIRSFESLRLNAYRDIGGVWTIGWGCTAGVCDGQVITADQADAMLAHELIGFEAFLNRSLLVGVTDNQFAALVSLSYNCGCGAIAHSSVLALVNSCHLAEAADSFLLWVRVHGIVVPGLVRRRTAERDLFLRADDMAQGLTTASTGGAGTAWDASPHGDSVQPVGAAGEAPRASTWQGAIADTVNRWLR